MGMGPDRRRRQSVDRNGVRAGTDTATDRRGIRCSRHESGRTCRPTGSAPDLTDPLCWSHEINQRVNQYCRAAPSCKWALRPSSDLHGLHQAPWRSSAAALKDPRGHGEFKSRRDRFANTPQGRPRLANSLAHLLLQQGSRPGRVQSHGTSHGQGLTLTWPRF
jgi:hypothetical protein